MRNWLAGSITNTYVFVWEGKLAQIAELLGMQVLKGRNFLQFRFVCYSFVFAPRAAHTINFVYNRQFAEVATKAQINEQQILYTETNEHAA